MHEDDEAKGIVRENGGIAYYLELEYGGVYDKDNDLQSNRLDYGKIKCESGHMVNTVEKITTINGKA
jgi:hypothetical protein